VVCNDAQAGRGERLAQPEKATVMGPARVIPREFPGTTVAVVDIAATGVEGVLEELLARPGNAVAIRRGEKRYVADWRQVALADQVPALGDGAVLITGGFGGMGLALAEALVREKGTPIALVARGELPAREGWAAYLRRSDDAVAGRIRAVERLEAMGARVAVFAADVSNVEEMRAAVAGAEAALGPIKGVIHAAGVIDDAPIIGKSPLAVEDVFTPKVHGTQVLDSIFPDGRLDWVALCSSSSTITAPAGQVDYVAANEYLNAFARSRVGGRTRVTAIDWGVWADAGMAAEAMAARTGRKGKPLEDIDFPLFRKAGFDGLGNRVLEGVWTTDLWVIGEHRTRAGEALLPGTGYLELVAEAMAVQGELTPWEIRDLTFLRPLAVPDGAEVRVRMTLPRSDAGYAFRVETVTPGGVVLHAEGEVGLGKWAAGQHGGIASVSRRWPASEAGDLRSPQEAHLRFGPRWRVLRERSYGTGEGLARLRMPPTGAEHMVLHPGLMDLATGWAMGLVEGYTPEHLWVPVSYRAVRVFAPLTEEVVSHVRIVAQGGDTATFDVTLCDPDGRVLVEVRGFSIRRMAEGLRVTQPRAEAEALPPPLSPAEERLRHNIGQGIRAEEGGVAFLRALALGQAQVAVTALDLQGLMREAEVVAAPAKAEQGFGRPQIDSDYVAPETEVERRLAGFWQELLGLEKVGVEDSFFDLGGHSLIAVRLFAMVRKTFQVDLPISVLFEAPTIRKIAALIPAQGAVVADMAEAREARAPARRFTHVVAMHDGEGGAKTPFFLVAGMFGNVLNLRHLAHLIGAERPVYGLQARGLYGDAAPHDDLVAAARDYLAEVREVQPRGPYLLGGFSGGGITAFEMARQLRAAGEEVGALVLLDTPLPQRRALTREDRLAIQKMELRAQGVGYLWRWARNRVAWEIEKRRVKVDAESDAPQFHNAAIEAAFYAAIARYPVGPWDGPMVLFRPPLQGKWEVAPGRLVNAERSYVLHDNDWGQYVPALQVFEVPGDHDSMVLEPNVRVLAARMRRVIEAAERAAARREAAE
jgi:thioesterase domain-containing protein/NAD(P)-dependent dehydrogenase (short-subunit alcohol dehydrogenase family)/acyl carrier protein